MANFRKLASGKWQARVHKDGKLVSLGTFRTKKEAEIEAAKVEERKYYGQTINDRNMLFDEAVKDWLEHKKANVKESTFVQLEVIVRNHIMPTFGDKKIMTLKRTEIKRWIATFGELDANGKEKYSFGSRLKYLSVIKSILHHAVHELEVLEKNPADKLKVPVQDTVAIKKEKVKYFSLQELNQLLDFMKTYKHQRFPEYQLYYMLMLFLSKSGLRISEALALRWEDIDGDKISINKQTSRDDNNKVKLTTLKNASSYRTIKIEPDVIRELKKFKMKQNELILGNPRFRKNEDGIIFQNYNGHYLTPSIIRETMQDYCKKAGVEYKGTHGFRHTHAVLLLESGVSLKYVSNRLGHKTIKTTADTYLDITEKIEEDELQKFASYTKR
ncbi:tyrosine-type recombinase/integrase [Brevibacillus laterosporus]|uniref:Site-specific integrase n=1 Tax=Brevibacillus laterosporus TaxID=1465 RepID=A0AAP3DDS8_BRELA|nr:site-specific integrase [Brevibacillus laterosporus]MCR8978656.1 site-specific integrase [Brevibacillus laterosporus]MCZ0805812.1 site-specific integrase [Brevibacillus laterosporus]MCZ0824422.1 site-specific integrase [Brevibacillus laterosporus]MCZ0848326.1 site-specific integrase [Brevibacillus laterosporus]